MTSSRISVSSKLVANTDVSTDVINGVYWEVTHNGDKNETYVDTYTKSSNVCVKGE